MNNMPNIASRLVDIAQRYPLNIAIAEPDGAKSDGTGGYRTITFGELNRDTDRIAAALIKSGVRPGMRLALFVRYGIDFISLVFALCKANVTLVLIDPGMGIPRMLNCLAEVEPDGFVAVPAVHAVRTMLRHRFPKAKHHITVGKRWWWGGLTLDEIRNVSSARERGGISSPVSPNEAHLAAIIFTSGSTGPPKGVAFTHEMFDTQAQQIAERFNIQPGDVDLACFPFFGLFDATMGVTAVIPRMNPTRPAQADPAKIVKAAKQWKITQAFASPALWNRVADYCAKTGERIDTLRRAISAGAPISAKLLAKLKPCIHPEGDIFPPYGATEALPVSVISATEVLSETAAITEQGRGVCVGKKFASITWKVIAITDNPIARWEDIREMPTGKIGELLVTGRQVTTEYVNRPEANAAAKIRDNEGRIWHRMGDLGYLDEQDRFWFCGRKAHRVVTAERTYFSIPCEAIFNRHPKVYRSALANSPSGTPRMFVEPLPGHFPKNDAERKQLLDELRELGQSSPMTEPMTEIRLLRSFPVDVRHNVKINRELLSTYR
ncbi:MAG: fatty acid CoA ligase family protein [Planctomycetaceae bacterium]|nr:fatty acid CoA ligase family protein [Planctomycetaceae bacterium]